MEKEWVRIKCGFRIFFNVSIFFVCFKYYLTFSLAINELHIWIITYGETQPYSLTPHRIIERGIGLCICKANFKLNTIRTTTGNCCLIFNGLPRTVLRKIGKLMQRVTAPILGQSSINLAFCLGL